MKGGRTGIKPKHPGSRAKVLIGSWPITTSWMPAGFRAFLDPAPFRPLCLPHKAPDVNFYQGGRFASKPQDWHLTLNNNLAVSLDQAPTMCQKLAWMLAMQYLISQTLRGALLSPLTSKETEALVVGRQGVGWLSGLPKLFIQKVSEPGFKQGLQNPWPCQDPGHE